MASTDEIAHRVAALIQSSVAGFRYFKSHHQLRRPDKEIVDDILVSITSARGGGAPYSLAFYFGVQHRHVEAIVAKAKGTKVTPFHRTIFQSSYNIASERDMQFDGDTVWFGIRGASDLERFRRPICTFISEFVLAYHARFHDIREARERLAANDGWVLNHAPYEQVLAIDALEGDSARAKEYLDWLQVKVDEGFRYDRDLFNEYYAALRLDHPTVLPEFSLTSPGAQ